MQSITREVFKAHAVSQRIKPRLQRDLRFNPESIEDWESRDFLVVWTRSAQEGVMVVPTAHDVRLVPFTMLRTITDSTTGRQKPIICDFCHTWQRGGNAARITFTRQSDGHNRTFLCCADLLCSLHVRDKTAQSKLSRTQLYEDLSAAERVVRLNRKIAELVDDLQIH